MSLAVRLAIAVSLFAAFQVFTAGPGFAGTFTVFGPERFTRATGAPVTVTRTFSVPDPSTTYTLRIQNGSLEDSELEMVSSSVITLNGTQVASPNEFNQQTFQLEKSISLSASNQLGVVLRSKPGGTLTVQIVGVDNDLPTITAVVIPPANAAGWHNDDVTVSFECADATSGIAFCQGPVVVSSEGAEQQISGTAVDLAGNSQTTTVTINLDKTPPSIAAAVAREPNAAGWHNSDPTVTFTCADLLSGIASCTPPVVVSAEGLGLVVRGRAVDVAGNSAEATVTINLDKTPPAVAITAPLSGTVSPTTQVVVRGTAEDANGIASLSVNGLTTPVTDGVFMVTVDLAPGPQTLQATAVDVADNSASASVSIIVEPPTEGEEYEPAIGTLLAVCDDCVLLRALPFPFSFFGKTYTEAFVSNNGRLTFSFSDSSFTANLPGFSNQPQIDAFWDDLDSTPTAPPGSGGLYVNSDIPGVFIVTWHRQREFGVGGGSDNTIQAKLFADGRFAFVYHGVTALDAFVGASPGPGAAIDEVDYTATPVVTIDENTAVLERFAGTVADRFDMDNHSLVFDPLVGGGYEVSFHSPTPTERGAVEGRASDVFGNPIQGVELVIVSSGMPGYQARVVTDGAGRYHVPDVPVGGVNVLLVIDGSVAARGAGILDPASPVLVIDVIPLSTEQKPLE